MFDLYILPINIQSGQEQAEIPGLFVSPAPKRANRLRSADRLILFVRLQGGNPPGGEEWDKVFQRLVDVYFQTGSSTTAAMRASAGELHTLLLERNRQRQNSGGPAIGQLILGVVRGDQLFVLHAGPAATYNLGRDSVQVLCEDSQLSGPGLGTSQTLNLKYYQVQLQNGGMTLLCPQAPDNLTPAALSHKEPFTLESLRRRLINLPPASLQGAILQFRSGKGEIHRLKVRTQAAPTAAVVNLPGPSPEIQPVSAETETPLPDTAPIVGPPSHEVTPDLTAAQIPLPGLPVKPGEAALPARSPTALRRPSVGQQGPVPAASPHPSGELLEAAESGHGFISKLKQHPWRGKLGSLLRSMRGTARDVEAGSRTVLQRMLPGMGDELPRSQTSLLLTIAVVVPLLVVAVSLSVYMNSGMSTKQREYLQTAMKYIEAAPQQQDPVLQRSAWIAALKQVELAEQSGRNEQTYALRRKAQDVLDQMDGINRLYLTPLLPEVFSLTTKITRIASSGSDIYLLDRSSNRILRLNASGQGYTLDNSFSCGGLSSRSQPIVNIMTLPAGNSYRATLLAVDEAGYQTYCVPNGSQLTNQLTPDDRGWGKVTGADLQRSTLYILDTQNHDILRYYDDKYDFGDQPRSFFSNQTLNLKDVIDIALSDDDMYLLRENGKMVICSAGAFNTLQVRCTDPAPYGDMRANRERQPLAFPDARFTQLEIVSPPDPSLFILDSSLPAIYHFSLRYMNLQRILQPAASGNFELPVTPITAFTVTPNRVVLVAYGNQLYYAALP